MALAIEKLFFNVSKKLIHFITEPIPLYHYETVYLINAAIVLSIKNAG